MSVRILPAALFGLIQFWSVSYSQGTTKMHAISLYGKPKYGPDFTHFDYVNPDAPKGGTLKTASIGTFDSFHPYIPKGNIARTYSSTIKSWMVPSIESLMVPSDDEYATYYGLLAQSLEMPKDRTWIIFNLHPKARWHDGVPVTADDVVWSFRTLVKKGHPHYRMNYAGVKKVEKLGDRRVKFTLGRDKNRELPLILGQLSILPKHYWEKRDFEKTTLVPPLGSGPYRVKKFEAGRYVVLERVEDYWGANLPVNRGQNNFDFRRNDYYREASAVRLALKSGDFDVFFEFQAKSWALGYDIPAVKNGFLKKELVRYQKPTGMGGLIMNMRREIFSDRRVRRALAYAFDFEWLNKRFFFGSYSRIESYFSNSDLAATGLPKGEELKILENYRNRLVPEVFTRPYTAPKTDGKGWPRENLKKAFELLAQAGWKIRNMKLVHETSGKPMDFEILVNIRAAERVILPFTKNLKRLGIDARIRLVDQSQYMNRLRSRDFDILWTGWGVSDFPGNELRGYWSSLSADKPNSLNYGGIKDPVVDELIELVIQASDRKSLVARTRALDRVLLWGHYVIPMWYSSMHRILYWDKFSRPSILMRGGVSLSRWWYDPEKAKELARKISAGGTK